MSEPLDGAGSRDLARKILSPAKPERFKVAGGPGFHPPDEHRQDAWRARISSEWTTRFSAVETADMNGLLGRLGVRHLAPPD